VLAHDHGLDGPGDLGDIVHVIHCLASESCRRANILHAGMCAWADGSTTKDKI
jgi:hypothetical protein